MFSETPHVGDHIKVLGKIKSIDESTGKVEASYDDVSIVSDKKKSKHKNTYTDHIVEPVPVPANQQMPPQSQTLDQALAQSFPRTQ